MKRILVTGAAGFVGQRLTRELRNSGYTVLESDQRMDPDSPDSRDCDISDAASVASLLEWASPLDGVIHLAAITFIPDAHANPAAVMEVNLGGTIHLIDAMHRFSPNARLVFVSTSEVYGPPQSLPVSESHPLNPQNPYAISKAAADQYCAYASARGLLDIVRIRPFNHSGAGQAPSFVLSDFAKQVVAMRHGDQSLQMKVGNLNVARDFSHVDDVIRAYLLALESGKSGDVYNVCSGNSVSIGAVLDQLLAGVDGEVERVIERDRIRPTDVPEVRGDHARLTAATGWKPVVSFEALLDDLVAYWEEQRS